jgi:hypothetical protein
MPYDEAIYEDLEGVTYPITQKHSSNTNKSADYWYYLVQIYGRCSITKPDDRPFAVAGIAKSVQPLLDDVYLAGLWMKDLPWNLGWSVLNVEGDLSMPSNYRCTKTLPRGHD